MQEKFLDPSSDYKSKYLENYKKECDSLFNKLTNDSNIDIANNKILCDKYNKLQNTLNKANKAYHKYKVIRISLIILCIIALIVSCVTYYLYHNQSFLITAICISITPVVWIITILLCFLWLNKTIKKEKNQINDLQPIVKQAYDDAYASIKSLLNLFDPKLSLDLISKSIPGLNLDINVDVYKYLYLQDRFNYSHDNNTNLSCVNAFSGMLFGNPFIVSQSKVLSYEDKIYTGSITVQEPVVTYSNGNRSVRMESRVITAQYKAPVPVYNYIVKLDFGSDVAKELVFTRKPVLTNRNLSESKIEKLAEKNYKSLEKLNGKDVNGSTFQLISNPEFEGLFYVDDRNNEVQYRLLFTPFAQQNMVKLIKNDVFGDDFTIIKNKAISTVILDHLITSNIRDLDLSFNKDNYLSINYEELKNNFYNYHLKVFNNIYFLLAPILAIPAYTMNSPYEQIHNIPLKAKYTLFDYESICNNNEGMFVKPKNFMTDVIYKSSFISNQDNVDYVNIRSFSHDIKKACKYVDVSSGGKLYSVPVYYDDYQVVFNDTNLEVSKFSENYKDYGNSNVKKFNDFIFTSPQINGSLKDFIKRNNQQ